MTVTKQQQLEWLASKIVKWPADVAKIPVSVDDAGNPKFCMPWDAFSPWDVMRVNFTRQEWQQERDKMSSKPEIDNSWHERGELPPAGCECEIHHEKWQDNEWEGVLIRAITEEYVIVKYHRCEQHYLLANMKFRPLRTEREKAIDAACAAVCKAGPYDHERELIGKLYDAGLLKCA